LEVSSYNRESRKNFFLYTFSQNHFPNTFLHKLAPNGIKFYFNIYGVNGSIVIVLKPRIGKEHQKKTFTLTRLLQRGQGELPIFHEYTVHRRRLARTVEQSWDPNKRDGVCMQEVGDDEEEEEVEVEVVEREEDEGRVAEEE
ncbi:unnamed protein product, partial [Nesidiocoris tenuis]